MARTGLMISSLLLYLKFFPTAEASLSYYNQTRCVDGLVLPSQIRYVKYFERVMTYFNGEDQPGRRCMLRGFRLHRCPYWIRPSITISDHNSVLFSTKKHPRTKDLSKGYNGLCATRRARISISMIVKAISIVALDPGEHVFYASGRDGKIYIAELNAQTTSNNNNNYGLDIIGTLSDQSKAICSLGFALDGFQLVVGSEDGMVRFWDT
ncbi:phosphatidylinositol 3,4,5-trisphosphate 3-phosphatase and protein-tyrosine-phosphatase PTEN2A isoform X1 [Lactuca sativa]|uniref:phosphatidylinositol 3,4,5-trisphosphate 3-phosphatase and protein-tyrosine-phosphatase PTEN2A isoform X1 n=1 Tax=Lactuca sativa TaxID=4236 RepID=UPI0022AF4CBA|nr:phosphatidylinositol 3,4,5-trisphosphate 3-phosphatase and protein-tyrosine-phosphatase PTEN2A isoform X1 [Lactuca sativa]